MVDLKAHVLHGKDFHVLESPVEVISLVLVIGAVTAASFYLNAVFAFAIARKGPPEIPPAFALARQNVWTILTWGFVIGILTGFAAVVVDRWGQFWFSFSLGIMVGVLMVTYVAVPSRLLGVQVKRSRRDKVSAAAVGARSAWLSALPHTCSGASPF